MLGSSDDPMDVRPRHRSMTLPEENQELLATAPIAATGNIRGRNDELHRLHHASHFKSINDDASSGQSASYPINLGRVGHHLASVGTLAPPQQLSPICIANVKRPCLICLTALALLACLGIVLIMALPYRSDRAQFLASHHPVNMEILAAAANPHPCCTVQECSCNSAPTAPQCQSLIANLQPGACNNGLSCCSQMCSTCFDICYDSCCDTCSQPAGNGTSETYPCNCQACHPYQCNPSPCSCTCFLHVDNAECRVGCGTCYTPTVQFSYVYSGSNYTWNYSTACGIGNSACSSDVLAEYRVGASWLGYVDGGNPSQAAIGVPSYLLSASIIIGLVIMSLVVVCGGLAAVVVHCIK